MPPVDVDGDDSSIEVVEGRALTDFKSQREVLEDEFVLPTQSSSSDSDGASSCDFSDGVHGGGGTSSGTSSEFTPDKSTASESTFRTTDCTSSSSSTTLSFDSSAR